MFKNIILVPYRNRKDHLDYFLNNTIPFIEALMPKTKVVIIEQCEGKLFNRGKVLNVGFKEYLHNTKYFLTHDIDINPSKICIEKYYNQDVEENHVMGIYTSQSNTLGGIIKINGQCIEKINGFPNDFWGWGIEDKALQNRSEFYNIKKSTNLTNKEKHPEFFKIFNDINDRKKSIDHQFHHYHEYFFFSKKSDDEKEKYIMSSGLNNLEYKIIERKELHKMVELIKVEI